MPYSIRKAGERDSVAIADIFNYFVENSFASYETRKVGSEFYSKIRTGAEEYPFHVVETGDRVVGFGFLRPYRNTEAFRHTVEITYFILPEHTRKGQGTRLLHVLEREAKKMGITTLLANISSPNQQSLKFHRKNGFKKRGIFKKIGTKFERDFDVVWMQKTLTTSGLA